MARVLRPKSIFAEALTVIAIGLLSFACATTQVSEPAEPAEAAPAKAEAMADAKAMKAEAMAMAEGDDPPPPELVNPPEIRADNGVLNIDLRIQSIQGKAGTEFAGNSYRWYGFNPSDTGTDCPDTYVTDGGFCFGAPAPTLRVRRESMGTPADDYLGDRINIHLTNALEPANPATAHNCNYEGVDAPPNCFHGDNITNFHFHGFHVSPNPNSDGSTYSDYVLMELWPDQSDKDPCEYPDCREGQAVFKLNDDGPLIQYQPEGSHWYHPHKHAATALQVMNGMAGAFIVEGPYDDWLTATICPGAPNSCEDSGGAPCDGTNAGCRVKEKLLILQQIIPDLGFPVATAGQPATPLTNGQKKPKVTIQPGEIQRWRYFNAGVTSAANYAIEFPKESFYGKCHAGANQDEWCVKMIAMDGVPFAKENYQAQPLLYKEDANGQCLPVSAANANEGGNLCFLLAAGNRADFLVQAAIEAQPGTHRIGIDLQGEVLGFMPERMREAVQQRLGAQHKRLAKLQLAIEPELVEFTIFRTHIGDSKVEGARLPIAGPDYPYNAAGTADSPYAAPPDLVKTIDSPTNAGSIEFKMTGYTGGLLPGDWGGDNTFRKAINQAMSCCRKWAECPNSDTKNCCIGDTPPNGCYTQSPPPDGSDVPCGELIGQFWIDGEQYSSGVPQYTAALGSKVQYEWQNALGPPIINSVPLAACPPLDGATTFRVQLKTGSDTDGNDIVEEVQVVAQVDQAPGNECSGGDQCISGSMKVGNGGWVDQQAYALVSQSNAVQHPIHIHVNPFQVIRDDHPGVPVFQDTIGLPVAEGGSFNVVQEYRSYDGTFVFHCHILGHEDRGMMQQFCVSSDHEDCTAETGH